MSRVKHRLAEYLDQESLRAEADPQLDALLDTAAHLTRALQHRSVPPPPHKLQFGRAQLLAAAASRPRRLSFRERLTAETRFAGKLLAALVVLLVVSSPLNRGVVGAARASMPGQLLYPLKLHVERVQFEGAEEPDIRVSLGLAFLGERVAEAQALVHEGRSIDFEAVVEAYQLVNQVLRAVAETPEPAMEDTLRYVSRQLRAHLEVLEALDAYTAPANAGPLNQITQGCRKGYLVTVQALQDPERFRTAYQEGRPELFLLPGENPLGGTSAPPGL